jgi:hypothetical protein
MEADRYRHVCRLVDQLCPHGRRARQQFADATIVKVFLYATYSDRPVSWACRATHWPDQRLRHATVGFTLPSQSTMSTRLRTVGVLGLLDRVRAALAERLGGGEVVKAIDAKPLRVGRYTKDRDAKRGRAGAGEMARGYKLHAVTAADAFLCWTVLPMNENDQVAAAALLPRLGERAPWGYVAGDNGYDANPVYASAAAANHQLIAPPRKANAHVRDVRRNTPQRIRSLDICADPLGRHCGLGESFGLGLLRRRKQVERNFGHLVMDGLHAPPAWVRTPHRVAAWTAAKLVQRMARQVQIKGLTT